LWGNGGLIAYSDGPTPVVSIDFQPDYFRTLLTNKLIAPELSSNAGIPGYSNCVFRVTADGPRKGTLLMLDPISIVANGDNPVRRAFYPAVTGPVNMKTTYTPAEIQRSSLEVVLGQLTRPQVQKEMGASITQAMGPFQSDFAEFEYWGEVLRLLNALVCWREVETEVPELLLISNCPGPFSPVELYRHLDAHIQKNLSYAGDWPLETAQFVETSIKAAVESLRARASVLPNDKSVPTVDETLRRINGYMRVRGIMPEQLDYPATEV
jgi:hypothetical protein